MAESVDALVSNTSGVTSIPVRPRVWVQDKRSIFNAPLFFMAASIQSYNETIYQSPLIFFNKYSAAKSNTLMICGTISLTDSLSVTL